MHRAVGLALLPRVETHQTVQKLPLLLERAVQRRGQRRRLRRVCRGLARLAQSGLTGLTLHEELMHVFRFEKTREPDELLFFRGAWFCQLPELLPLEHDPIEVGDR